MKKLLSTLIILLAAGSGYVSAQDDVSEFDAALMDFAPEGSNSSFTIGAGLFYHQPNSDYVPNNLGVNFLVGGSYRKHYFAFDFDIGGGRRAKRDIKASTGTIYEDQHLSSYGLTLLYGRLVHRTGRLELTPLVGIGGRGYQGGIVDEWHYDYDKSRSENKIDKAAMTLGLGMNIDLIMRQKFVGGLKSSNQMLTIKPYCCVGKYGFGMNIVPSFNVAVLWCFNVRN